MAASRHPSHGRRSRHRRHRPPIADPYMICLSAIAVACLALVLIMLVTRPRWSTPVLSVPLGALLLGGLAGLVTLGASPSWPRRIGPEPLRLAAVTWYRLLSAAAIGGLAFTVIWMVAGQPHGAPGAGFHAAAFAAGLIEKPVNDALLKGLGVLAPREDLASS